MNNVVARCVELEHRDDVCVLRCFDAEGADIGVDLPEALATCAAEPHDVVIDVDELTLDEAAIAALRHAGGAVRASGGQVVYAVEDREARAVLAAAGLMAPAPAAPSAAVLEDIDAGLVGPARWEHGFSFPAAAAAVPGVRRRIAALAEVAGLGGTGLFEFSLAVAEALNNAVKHGSPWGAADEVAVRFFCFEHEVAVEVVDRGGGMLDSPLCAPAVSSPGGRGIHFMRALADAVQFACTPGGLHVLLVKRRD